MPNTIRRIAESKFWSSFHFAFQGIIYATKTQPNMRIHLGIAVLVLAATLYLHLQRIYVVVVILLVAFVVALELLNTAVEAIVDLLTVAHHPLAKTAKDAAAGAVLVGSLAALVIGYLVFYQAMLKDSARVVRAAGAIPEHTVVIALGIVAIVAIFAKTIVGRGSPLQGGAVSGHAAIAVATANLIALFSHNPLVALLAYFLAFLVAQSRVEAGIHEASEVLWGGLVGLLVSLAIFLLIRPM